MHGAKIMSNLDGTNTIGGTSGPEFAYFDTQGFKFQQFGPINAGNGMAVSDLTATADPDNPDNQTISIRILKRPKPPAQSGKP